MTSTDIAVPETAALTSPDLESKIKFARMLAAASLLPQAFRSQPANVLYAVSYGEMLGLPPMAAITGIHVIEGKPSISAGLISALVRRAGHKLRVIGDEHQAQAELVRADDPTFTYKSVWTLDRAKQADLLGKTNWKRYPAAMLKARAISEVARDACQEVLLGMQYTADELGDMLDDGGEQVFDGYDTLPNGRIDTRNLTDDEQDAAGLMPQAKRVEHAELRRDGQPAPGSVEKLPATPDDDLWLQPEPEPVAATQARKPELDKMTALFEQLQLDTEEQDTVIAWFAPGEWTATKRQILDVIKGLTPFLADAQGDIAEARMAMWDTYRRMQEATT